MRTFVLSLLLSLGLSLFVLGTFCVATGYCDVPAAAPRGSAATPAAGSSSTETPAPAPPAPLPATLHDPLEQPMAALDDARALRSHGWAAMAFGLLLMVARWLAGARTSLQDVPVLGAVASWLAVGRRAVYITAAGAIAAAGYNALVAGGSPAAALWAAGAACFAAVNPLISGAPAA